MYDVPPPRRPEPPRDEVSALIDEAASEARSVFVSQLAAKLTSRDVGMFFEDKLGRGSVRDARVVTDRITRRSKGFVLVLETSNPSERANFDAECRSTESLTSSCPPSNLSDRPSP